MTPLKVLTLHHQCNRRASLYPESGCRWQRPAPYPAVPPALVPQFPYAPCLAPAALSCCPSTRRCHIHQCPRIHKPRLRHSLLHQMRTAEKGHKGHEAECCMQRQNHVDSAMPKKKAVSAFEETLRGNRETDGGMNASTSSALELHPIFSSLPRLQWKAVAHWDGSG